jgi:hypothetical protein
MHWELIKAVTGIEVGVDSQMRSKKKARRRWQSLELRFLLEHPDR